MEAIRIGLRLVLTLAVLCFSPAMAAGQEPCSGTCGDWNGDDLVTGFDPIGMLGFLNGDDPLSPNASCADVDDYQNITFGDFVTLVRFVYAAVGPIACPPSNGPNDPQPNSSFLFAAERRFPADASSMILHLDMFNFQPFSGFWLPLEVTVDGQAPAFGSLSVVDAPAQGIKLGGGNVVSIISDALSFPLQSGQLVRHVAEIELIMSPESFDRPIAVQWTGFPTAEQPAAVLTSDMAAWAPHFVNCAILPTGDVNQTGDITSADIIEVVNYVFKSAGPPQPCAAAGDVNCSGSVTSSDIIGLVNFVFKGGAPPCDACTSPLASEC